jgi:hypothetical protein
MKQASKLITCAVILHNLAIEFGDNCEGFDDVTEPDDESNISPEDDGTDEQPARPNRERRRNQFLQFFSRN